MKNVLNVINFTICGTDEDGKDFRMQAEYRHLATKKLGLRAAQNVLNREQCGVDPVVVSVESFIV